MRKSSPLYVAVDHGIVSQRGQRSGGGVRLRFLARTVAGFIVGVHIGLTQHLVVLAEELAEVVGNDSARFPQNAKLCEEPGALT